IDEVEVSEGHQRTILLGDMNMNPFEAGMVIAGGLHAVMSRRVASRMTRLVQKQRYKFFYNPMWNHLGDHGDTCGTFYYEGAEHLCYYWNLFDQGPAAATLARSPVRSPSAGYPRRSGIFRCCRR